jgi:hypothetical protein
MILTATPIILQYACAHYSVPISKQLISPYLTFELTVLEIKRG